MAARFGQVVVGPPGAGKTTYCDGMQQFLGALGRETAVVNLDPANETYDYECAVDIADLITVQDVMEELNLGPNGAMVYCMEFLLANLAWLDDQLEDLRGRYVLFDFPGQVELYTHHEGVFKLLDHLQRSHNWRLVAVHLVDAQYCVDPSKYIAASLLSMTTMVRLCLPHVNVLSKLDLIHEYGSLDFELEEYLTVSRIREIAFLAGGRGRVSAEETERELRGDVEGIEGYAEPARQGTGEDAPAGAPGAGGGAFDDRYGRLNAALAELLEDFGLTGYMPLQVEDQECMRRLVATVDKANGYTFVRAVADEMEASKAAKLSAKGKQGAEMLGAAAARAMGSFIARADTSFSEFVDDVSERYGVRQGRE